MLAYLNLKKYLDYDLNRPPSPDNPGGGVATKTQRVLQACAQWMISGTDKLSVASKYNTVLVEPLAFSFQDSMSLEDKVKAYEDIDGIKILYCTEMAFLRLPKPFRDSIANASDHITCVNHYHRNMFHKFGIRVDSILCDPIPEDVFKEGETKERVIIAANRIDWKKNTEGVVDAFNVFKAETDFKLEYIGLDDMWGDNKNNPRNRDFVHQLEDVCDTFHGTLSQSDVAKAFMRAAVFFHCAYHDVYSESLWEAMHCGAVPFAFGYHPLFEPITEHKYTDIETLIETLNSLQEADFEEESTRVKELAMKSCAYPVFQQQLSDIFKKLGGN